MSVGADIGAIDMVLAVRNALGGVEFLDLPLSDTERVNLNLMQLSGKVLPAVGCGAWRLSETLNASSGVLIERHREPVCIWTALEYILSREKPASVAAHHYALGPHEVSHANPISSPYLARTSIEASKIGVSLTELNASFPILLVNVKTGTSFYRVDSPADFVRVGGSSIGSSTINGLSKNLTGTSCLSASVTLAQKLEHPSEADLLVSDIYGGDCDSIGLAGNIIASCFGKANNGEVDSPDLAKSLLDLLCINTAQLTNLHASLNGCKTAVIVGSIGDSAELAECIQRVLWILNKNNEPLKAVFLQRSRYLGCLGALLRREELVAGLSEKFHDIPVNTATVADGVDDETYTHLRVTTPPTVPRLS